MCAESNSKMHISKQTSLYILLVWLKKYTICGIIMTETPRWYVSLNNDSFVIFNQKMGTCGQVHFYENEDQMQEK